MGGIKDKTAYMRAKMDQQVSTVKNAWKNRSEFVKSKVAYMRAKMDQKKADLTRAWNTIKAANGTYTDLQERFAGDTETLGAFQGIRTRNYVYYEGNINNPSACVIEWDGAAGFDLETYTNDQAVDKCPFHIVGSYAEGAMHTSVV